MDYTQSEVYKVMWWRFKDNYICDPPYIDLFATEQEALGCVSTKAQYRIVRYTLEPEHFRSILGLARLMQTNALSAQGRTEVIAERLYDPHR